MVSRSAYYNWLKTDISKTESNNKSLLFKIKEIFYKSRCNYGTRRIKHCLLRTGLIVSRRRIANLMKTAGLRCKIKHKFKVTTDSKHNNPISPNLLNRNFNVENPNKVFAGDITYIKTKQGFLYLASNSKVLTIIFKLFIKNL